MSSVCVASFIAIALLGQDLSDGDEVATFPGQAFGKKYTITMTYAVIKNTPDWTDSQENPPVSAKKAVKLATSLKDSLSKGNKKSHWELTHLTLMKIEGKWIWLATFTPGGEELLAALSQEADLEGSFPQLTLPVLMDGAVIKPKFEENGS